MLTGCNKDLTWTRKWKHCFHSSFHCAFSLIFASCDTRLCLYNNITKLHVRRVGLTCCLLIAKFYLIAFILSCLVTINLMNSFWEQEGIHLPSCTVLIICILTPFSPIVFLSSYNFLWCCVSHYLPCCTVPVLIQCSRLMSNNKRFTYSVV